MMNSEKRYVPGTNPEWGVELPDGYSNSLVDKYGRNHNDGYNFDESDTLTENQDLAERIAKKIWYSGFFVNPEELYNKFPPHLAKPVKTPHVTTNYKPDVQNLHLDSLGSKAKIIAIGYGNDGENEGLLVRVEADDPVLQKVLDERMAPDRRYGGEPRHVVTHITLSVSEKGSAVNTKYLDFTPLDEENQIVLTGAFMFHMGNDSLVDSIDTLEDE